MPVKFAPKQLPSLDDAKTAICEAVMERLTVMESQKGDAKYFGIPKQPGEFRGTAFSALGITGELNVGWFGLRDEVAAQAATVETLKAQINAKKTSLTREEREAMAKELLA